MSWFELFWTGAGVAFGFGAVAALLVVFCLKMLDDDE